MKTERIVATYDRLRTEPLWRLLAADHGPRIIALLQTHLYENDRTLPASIFCERVARDLEALRGQGYDLPQTAQHYLSDWLASGYLERRFPPGASEEAYELSTASIAAVRFLSGLVQPHLTATESRLALVIEALVKLADDTDNDKLKRTDRLLAEQARIEKEIEAIHNGRMKVLAKAVAVERAREIINLSDELTGDFRYVRDQFERLNRNLREKIVDNDGNRGEVLGVLFSGIDLIVESEAGKTFSAFWQLLTDPEQSAIFSQAIDNMMSRDFIVELDIKERRFLLRLMRILLEQGGSVHDVMQGFARSLKTFVQSREYLEQRRLNQLLKTALHAALMVKENIKVSESLAYTLTLTSSRLRSFSQWMLYDPLLQAAPKAMLVGEKSTIDLRVISEHIAQSEIDFYRLKINVLAVLEQYAQATVAMVLTHFPATQGLGSVIGLLALGSRHGYQVDEQEIVSWVGQDDIERRAYIPKIFFLRERIHEF